MNRRNAMISSATAVGVTVTLCGVTLLQLSGSWAPGAWLGSAILVAGFLTMMSSLLGSAEPARAAPPAIEHLAHRRTVAVSSEANPSSAEALMRGLNKSFLAWADALESQADIWASFDRWMRDALFESLHARRVRCFHVTEGQQQLTPLSGTLEDPIWQPLSGLVEHVIATGRRYLRGAPEDGELVQALAGQLTKLTAARVAVPDWICPVRQCGRVLGVIAVGELPADLRQDSEALEAIASLLTVFWRDVRHWEELSLARRTDRASGVLTRMDVLTQAELVLNDARRDGEPIVVLALSVEGLRRLDDQGLWELRNWLVQQIGLEMHRRLRSDDLIGRFSDDRFIAVLRRLDVGLGELIARKLLEAVKKALYEKPIVDTAVRLRCGLAGSDGGGLPLLLKRAFEALNNARLVGQDVAVAAASATPPSVEVTA